MTTLDAQRVDTNAAGPAGYIRRLEAAALDIAQLRGALEDALNLRDDLVVRALEQYGERGSTGKGMLATRQVARAAGVSQGQVNRIMAAT